MAHGEAGQIIGFAPAPGGALYLPAANAGKLLRLQLAPATNGTLLSEVFDANQPSMWGRAELTSGSPPASYTLETRTGNVDNPART